MVSEEVIPITEDHLNKPSPLFAMVSLNQIVELVKSSPYTIRLEGNIVMEKGPFAQQPIPVTTQWTYAKNYPEKGHVTLATYTIKQIVKS